MKKLVRKAMALLLALCLMAGILPLGALAVDVPFRDILGNMRYYDFISNAYKYGLVNGTSPTTFSPKRPVTRCEAITILGRMQEKISGEKLGQSQPTTFTDVPAGIYYEKYASWGQAMGIIAGYGDGTFRPYNPVTYSELAVIFHRYLKWIGKDGEYPPKDFQPEDKDEIPSWALPAAEALSGFDIFSNYNFLPFSKVNREVAAACFVKLYERTTYTLDMETPRLKYRYSIWADDGPLWVSQTNCTVLDTYKGYTDYMDNLHDPSWPNFRLEEQVQNVPLTVDEAFFQQNSLLAVNSIAQGAPAYDVHLSKLEVQGQTAFATLVMENSAGTTADSTGVLIFLAVPKTVIAGEHSWRSWTDYVNLG